MEAKFWRMTYLASLVWTGMLVFTLSVTLSDFREKEQLTELTERGLSPILIGVLLLVLAIGVRKFPEKARRPWWALLASLFLYKLSASVIEYSLSIESGLVVFALLLSVYALFGFRKLRSDQTFQSYVENSDAKQRRIDSQSETTYKKARTISTIIIIWSILQTSSFLIVDGNNQINPFPHKVITPDVLRLVLASINILLGLAVLLVVLRPLGPFREFQGRLNPRWRIGGTLLAGGVLCLAGSEIQYPGIFNEQLLGGIFSTGLGSLAWWLFRPTHQGK